MLISLHFCRSLISLSLVLFSSFSLSLSFPSYFLSQVYLYSHSLSLYAYCIRLFHCVYICVLRFRCVIFFISSISFIALLSRSISHSFSSFLYMFLFYASRFRPTRSLGLLDALHLTRKFNQSNLVKFSGSNLLSIKFNHSNFCHVHCLSG